MVLDKQMELMEHNTRQKLEEFKRKLAESQNKDQSQVSQPDHAKPESASNHKASNNNSYKQEHVNQETHSSVKPDDTQHRSVVWANKTDRTSSSRQQSEPSSQVNTQHTVTKAENKHKRTHSGSRQERPQSIQNILNKYRTNTDPREIEKSQERSAKVEEILARYRNEKAGSARTASSEEAIRQNKVNVINGVISTQPNQAQYDEYARQPSGKTRTKEYDIVSQPNSAMVFRAVRLNSSPQKGIEDKYNRESPSRKYGLDEKHVTKDFESTLKSMLETKNGHNKKRTDAWGHVNGKRQPNDSDKVIN